MSADRSAAFDSPAAIWRAVTDELSWRARCPTSSITDGLDLTPRTPAPRKPAPRAPAPRTPATPPATPRPADPARADDPFDAEGYAAHRLLAPPEADGLRAAIAATVEAGFPAVFAYVYDALWAPLPALLAHLRERLGPCAALADGWAWHIRPGEGRGWLGHRGFPEPRRPSPPLVVNAWLAASRVTPRHSAIVVVPRSRDPHFPLALDEAPDEREGVLLTAEPGDVLYWDARIYHWGSQSHADAAGPRISASYTVAVDAYDPDDPRLAATLGGLDARLQLIAEWIATYGHQDPTITPAFARWATLWRGAAEASAQPRST